jgi:hypothetical protein
MIILQVIHQIWDVTSDSAFRSRIWASIGSVLALGFMFQLAIIGIYSQASKVLKLAWNF